MKFVAATLSCVFTFTQVVFAHVPTLSVWETRRAAQTRPANPQLARLMEATPVASAIGSAFKPVLPTAALPARFSTPSDSFLKLLPPEIVTVRDIETSSKPGPLAGRRFIVVQDVHLNADAQRNIADLLFRLMGADQAGLVAVEGAAGAFDFGRFRRYPDKSVTDAVARAFLLANRIGAPSFAGITSKTEPPLFWGIDDPDHYDRNVEAYRDGLKEKPSAEKCLSAEARELAQAKRASYTPALMELDADAASYENGSKGLGEHLEFLSSKGAFAGLSADARAMADRFVDAWHLERSLDFTRADRERRAALEKLVAKLSKDEIDGLVALSLGYRGGRISFGDYHRDIASLIERKGVSLDKLPAFQSYLRYVLLSDGIQADRLLRAAREAEAFAFDTAATTDEQRRLVSASRRLALEKKLIEFSMTPQEWSEYANDAGASREASLSPFKDFYREAETRSERMVANLARVSEGTDRSKMIVLIVGGFHAPDVVRRLHDLGASAAVVSPKLAKVDAAGGTAYLSVFSREKTPLDKLFAGEKLFVYPAFLNVGAPQPSAYTGPANEEFAEGQALAPTIGLEAVVRTPGRFLAQIRRHLAPRRVLRSLRNTWRGLGVRTPAAVPVQMGRLWNWIGTILGLSPELRARLSFVEELFYVGVLIYGLPYAMASLGIVSPASVPDIQKAMFVVATFWFTGDHTRHFTWREDGKLRAEEPSADTYIPAFLGGIAFRSMFLFGFGPATVLTVAVLGHLFWNNVLTRIFRGLPLLMISSEGSAWWKDSSKTYVAMSVPIYALRRNPANDPGIGKFTDLGRTYRDVLKPQNVKVVLLLPHYATLDESPYAPVSLFAVQERYIDWAAVPEVSSDQDLMASLVAPADQQNEVDYAAVAAREDRVAAKAFAKFRAAMAIDRERAEPYNLFLRINRGWLREYADFMAIHQILGTSSMNWTDEQVARARADGRFQRYYDLYCYKQYIGYRQFAAALDEVQAAGGKVLVDIPFFRGKDSVSVRNSPQFFRDPKHRSAGIRNAYTDQTWGDLALWNWPELAKGSYDYILGPMRHWLRFGVDGARNDAAHFYYPIGQFGNGDEPGDAVVNRIASTFQQHDALPVAEAFENRADDVSRHGLVVIDGNWQRFSTHDDTQRNHVGDPVNFLKDIIGRIHRPWRDRRTAQFLAFTLGDLVDDPRTVKKEANGRSEWRYRRPLTPPSSRGGLVKFQTETLPALRESHRPIWDAAPEVRAMFEAATESFVKAPRGVPEIWAASRDWFFEQWGRDTFIALPGILLATGRFDTARELIRSFARFERNGLIPNRIWDPSNPATIEYNTSDASMWFIQALQSYVEYTGDWKFVEEMSPVMRRIMQGYMNGTGWDDHKHIPADTFGNGAPIPVEDTGSRSPITQIIKMDPADGLINVPPQSTWMDADPHGQGPVTPRGGKPVEINALWYANLRFMAQLCERQPIGNALEQAAIYTGIADRVRQSFNDEFWNESEQTLYDLAPGADHSGAIRPNMLIAVSKGGDLLTPERKAKVLESAQKELWTPYGPRTLSPRDSNYHGTYETGRQPYPGEADFRNHKDYAYHQGTVWPWLIGPYVDALVAVRRDQGQSMFQIQEELRSLLEPIVDDFVDQGSLPEVYDGSPRGDGRQHPGGTSSQAWSVAEVFRVLAEYEVLAPRVVEVLDDEGILARLESLARNYQQKFRFAARALLARLNAKDSIEWTTDERRDADDLIQSAATAMDWHRGWLANSKHAAALKRKPVFVVSMEARESASQNASTREEFEEMRRNNHDRLTTNQGGLGDLGGGWKGALGSMGAVTTFNPRSDAPEVYFFIPDYRHGVRLSRVDERGWPISDTNREAWNAVRPQDVGIPRIEDPKRPGQPLTVEVPVYGLGPVRAQFYAVEKDGMKSILVSVDETETGDKLGILNRAYQGKPSTEERFRQQWFFGIAIQKFKETFELPDGPLHLNETATFASAVGRIREHLDRLVADGVPLDVAYDTAMRQVGSELVFFTHTLVDAGVDKFYDNVRVGDYVRELFEGSHVLNHEQAWAVTRWMIEGKGKQTDPMSFPGFRFDGKGAKGHPYYSPLNFLARLAYRANGDVVAVSRLNAKKAGQFLSEDQGILTPEQVAAKPVLSETNATDEEFFVDAREARVMKLEAAEPTQRHPERILNPADPKAHEIHKVATGGRDLPADYRTPAMPTSELRAVKEENRARAINRVRWGMQDQYIRNITDLMSAVKDTGRSQEQLAELHDRLKLLKARWESWTGQPFPENVADMHKQELVNLMDPHAVTAVWARRIVDYKRMLLTVFGPNLPQLEEYVQTMGDNPKAIDAVIERIARENHYASLDEMFKDFIDLVEKQNVQLIFAGPTFDYSGRAMVAVLDRVIERLSATHPKITNRVVYVEGYNDELSHYLVQGADIWLNTPKRPLEASGTSGMKADAVNETILDGWGADGGFDGLNVIAIRKGSPDLPMDHPDTWPGRKRTDEEKHHDLQESRAIGMNLDEYRYYRALSDTDGFEMHKALAHALSRAVKNVVRENPTVSSHDHLVSEIRRVLSEHSYHGDYDAVVAFAEQEWKAQRYLIEEASSLHAGLAGAAQTYQTKPEEWWNLVRRSLYFKMMVYSVRNSFVGRYIPTSDPEISEAGFEAGIFQLWENAARRMEGQRLERSNVLRFARLRKELHFTDPHAQLSFPADADRVDVTVKFNASPEVVADADLYLYVGHPSGEWSPVVIPRESLIPLGNNEWTGQVSLTPEAPGFYQVTMFAAPRGVNDPRLRRWSNGMGDNSSFERLSSDTEGQRNQPWTGPVVPLGLLGAWRYFPNLSLGKASLAEGIIISVIGLAALGLILTNPMFAPAFNNTSSWALVQTAARVTLLVGAVVTPVVLFAHLVFGILQPGPGRRPVWSLAVALRSTVVAMSSLVGLPLVVMIAVLWRAGIDLQVVGAGTLVLIVVASLVTGAFVHRGLNLRLLEWYNGHRGRAWERTLNPPLPDQVRRDLIRELDPILRFLSERTITTITTEVEQLRDRTIDVLPDHLVQPVSASPHDERVDALIVFGSHYLEVPERAARLYWSLREKNPDMVVIFAGGMGPRSAQLLSYWGSEAELFKDRFIAEVRAIRHAEMEKGLRKALGIGKTARGQWLIQLVNLADDLLFRYVGDLPRPILLETESKDTGSNIRNVMRLLDKNHIDARNLAIMTAGVFQLRLRASMLQQYRRPVDRLLSFSATRPKLDTLTDAELAELADEARGQIKRLMEYPNKKPEPFTVPLKIDSGIQTAYQDLIATLTSARLMGYSGTSPDEKVVRKPRTSLITMSGVALLIIGAAAFLPGFNDHVAWGALVVGSAALVIDIVAGILLGVVLYVILFSHSVGRLPEGRLPRRIRPIFSVLRPLLTTAVTAVYIGAAWSVIPVWISMVGMLLMGAVIRTWALAAEQMSEEKNGADTHEFPTIPGAAGFWGRTGLSLRVAGGLEGFGAALLAVISMGAVGALFLWAPGSLHLSPVAQWAVLTGAGLAVGAFLFREIHRRTGVTLRPGASPDFNPDTIRRATRAAFVSLAGVPLIAAGLLLPGIGGVALVLAGFLAAIIPHAARNAAIERASLSAADVAEANRVAALLRELKDARAAQDDVRIADALAGLNGLEHLNLEFFGREASLAARDAATIEHQVTDHPAAFAEWQLELSSIQRGQGAFAAGTLGGFIGSAATTEADAGSQKHRDHLALVAAGADQAALFAEANRALAVAEGRPLTIIVPAAVDQFVSVLGDHFQGQPVIFLRESDFSRPNADPRAVARAVEDLLLKPALQDSGKLKLLINRDAGVPDFLINPLLELGRQDRYRDLVELVIVTALSNGAFAVRASLSDIERAMTFRDLVLKQA